MPEGIWKRITRAFLSHSQKLSGDMKLALAKTSDSAISDVQGEVALLKCEHFQPGRSNFETVLKIEGISKSFGGVLALRDVNMEVPQGKILSIIGPNGAGKTTLFNVINGYLKPEAGKIFLEGRDVTDFRPHVLCKMGMGRTFQVAQIFHNMTVLENVMIGALSRWGNTRQARTIALEVVEKMGLTNRAHYPAVGLSIWETKILEIGRALATQSKLLLLDEPMAGLNPEETYRIGEMIKVIAKSGITVMVIEHVVQSLLKVADLMIGLDEGRKVAEGTPEEVTSNPHIIEAYLGTKWKTRYAKG
jgi:ABC-type branched-subunit amino acid transport system ATPase component